MKSNTSSIAQSKFLNLPVLSKMVMSFQFENSLPVYAGKGEPGYEGALVTMDDIKCNCDDFEQSLPSRREAYERLRKERALEKSKGILQEYTIGIVRDF